jgi:hypothetical protein
MDAARRDALKAVKEQTAAAREVSKTDERLRRGQLTMLDDEPPFTPGEWSKLKADLQADLATAKERLRNAERLAEALKAPPAALSDAVEAVRQAALAEGADAASVAAQRAAIERLFARCEVVTGPADEPPSSDPADAMAEAETAKLPQLTAKGRRIYLVPIPRPEVAERFGGFPLDSLQNVREGLPCRIASGPVSAPTPPPAAKLPGGTSSASAATSPRRIAPSPAWTGSRTTTRTRTGARPPPGNATVRSRAPFRAPVADAARRAIAR